MASIQKRGKNSFLLVVEAGYKPNGKRDKRTRTIKIEDEALLRTTKKLQDYLNGELIKFKTEVEAGEYISPEKMTFGAFANNEWLNKFASKNYSPRSLQNMTANLKSHILPAFGDKRLDQIKTMHLVNFMNALEKPEARKDGREGSLSGSSRMNIYKTLKSVLGQAKEWRVIQNDPMDGVKPPKVEKKKASYYDESEAEAVIAALYKEPDVWRLYFLGAMLGGFRRGELLALEWSDVKFDENSFDINKSITTSEDGEPVIGPPKWGSEGIVDMPEWYMSELKEYQLQWKKEKLQMGDRWEGGNHQYVFHSGTGKPYFYTTPTGTWTKFLKRHGLKRVRLHDLRHTAATLLIDAGSDMRAVQERLRHARYSDVTQTYAHVTKKVSKETASKLEKFAPKKSVNNSSTT